AAGAVDLLARERGQHPIAVRVLAGRTAERPGQRRPSAEPRDRDRGVGGAAAIDDEKALRLGLCVRLRKAIDPEHLVEHDDPGAQDRAPGGAGANGTQHLPPLIRKSVEISRRYKIAPAVPANHPAKAHGLAPAFAPTFRRPGGGSSPPTILYPRSHARPGAM